MKLGTAAIMWFAFTVIVAVAWILPEKIAQRDAAVNIAWPRPPVPENERIVTIQHSHDEIQRFGLNEARPNERASLLIAPQADLYYEAHVLRDDDTGEVKCSKIFVIFPGTNAQTWLYRDLIDSMRSMGFCTLVFDWRSHGRSEDTPGDITSELFMIDAAALIQEVFPGRQVHVFGWSLGGFVGYQLAIYKPELVKSLIVHGSTSCFAPSQKECVDQWNLPKIVFSQGAVMRLMGLEIESYLVAMVAKLKTPFTKDVRRFFLTLHMEQKVKTPRVWLKVQGAKTFFSVESDHMPVSTNQHRK